MMVKVEWDEAAECFMFDFTFETAPPGHEEFHMALGVDETLHLYRTIERALQNRKET